MRASLKPRLSAKEKCLAFIAFFSLITWYYPVVGKAYAQTNATEKSSLIFEIKPETQNSTQDLLAQNSQNKNEVEVAQAKLAKAKIDLKVKLVRNYLEKKNSPFANYTEILLAQDDWKTILAISNSESNMGLHCYRNNCSGIFGGRGLKPYASIPDWMVDFQSLIDKRYKNQSLNQMDGIYVQPRSASWLKASTSVYDDLTNIENQVNANFQSAQA